MLRLAIIQLFLFIFTLQSYCQQRIFLQKQADTIAMLCEKILKEKNPDRLEEINYQIRNSLQLYLSYDSAVYYGLESCKCLSDLRNEKNNFRIITYYYINANDVHQNNGLIWFFDENKHPRLVWLEKSNEKIQNVEYKQLSAKQWLGYLYYHMIPVKHDGKTYYTLLGWDGNDILTNKKVIDVVSFDKFGNPVFGAPIFTKNNSHPYRFVFEYSEKVAMTLKYSEQAIKGKKKLEKMIVFDRLSPSNNSLIGQYQFYFPETNIFDGLVFRNGYWEFEADVDARNRDILPEKKKKPKKSDVLIPKRT